MATETQRPDGELSDSGLVASDFTDHDDDPDSVTTTTSALDNNTNTEYGVDFPTPTGNPTTGAGLQEFRAGVGQFDTNQSGTPTARIELWENGSLVRAGSEVNVTSSYQVISFTWDASELSTADGSLVQCKVVGSKTGGPPGARNSVNIGSIEWNVDYQSSQSYTLVADSGTFSMVGQDAGLLVSYRLNSEQGSFSMAGQDAGLLVSYKITAGQGSYSLAGQDADLKVGYRLTAENGVFSMSGQDASLLYNRVLTAESGTFTMAGQDADLIVGGDITLVAESGTFNMAGQDADFLYNRLINAESGSFSLSGQDVDLKVSYKLLAESGDFAMMGQSADLIYSEDEPSTQSNPRKLHYSLKLGF